ncbi:MAG TPA: hypothetical protein DEO32_04785 [Ruminococcaceae bacterium]|nr:hypothetical protein [Oscillospiraceae bacterium]
MKGRVRALCAFFVFYILFFSGCQSAKKPQPKPEFKAAYIAEYRGMKIKGRILSTRQGNINLTVSQPKTLEGLALDCKNGVLTLGRQDISCTADEAYLPKSSFFSMLREALSGIADGRAEFMRESGEDLVYCLKHGINCEIITDDEGKIKSLTIENPKLALSLSGVELL